MEQSRSRRIITLTTDFGLSDHYVGTMKGVLLSRCPDAQLVDISHQIEPFSIWTAAYTIDQAAPFFPEGSVHVVVVDPGVGTARKGIVLESFGQYFVAPDNGVLSLVFRRDAKAVAHQIVNRDLYLPQASSTFHGRDIFAPVAAALAAGTIRPEDVGPVVQDIQILDRVDAVDAGPSLRAGAVLSVDRFGNVITNFRASESKPLASQEFEVRTVKSTVTASFTTFEAAPAGICFAYVGSSGNVELGMNRQSAALHLGLKPGDVIEFAERRTGQD